MKKQQGWTVIGSALMVIIFALATIVFIRVVPYYYEYFKIISIVKNIDKEDLVDELMGYPTVKRLRGILGRRFAVDEVRSIKPSDVKVDNKRGYFLVGVNYQAKIKLFFNWTLLIDFDRKLKVDTSNGDVVSSV